MLYSSGDVKMSYSFEKHAIKHLNVLWRCSWQPSLLNQMTVSWKCVQTHTVLKRAFGNALNWACRCFCVRPYGYNLWSVFSIWWEKLQCYTWLLASLWFLQRFWGLRCLWWGACVICCWVFKCPRISSVCGHLFFPLIPMYIHLNTVMMWRTGLVEVGEAEDRLDWK